MGRKIFVNVPVSDLKKSMAFFGELGFAFNPQFTDDNAACMVISEENYAMLLVRPFFQSFTEKAICDTSTHVEVFICLSCESRDEVDALIAKAISLGGKPAQKEPQDHGFMYGNSFFDLDGHAWELVWMDPATIQPQN